MLALYEHDLTDKLFGDYHVIRQIGSGAMAEVYLAQQRSLSRRVALKVLRPELAEDENCVKRFVQEAQSAGSLVHQNIVHIYEVNCIEGYWYIAQEYVQGSNLRMLLQREGALAPQQVGVILWQVASALYRAALLGIVHRDIKPDNILVSDEGEMKVADFGLAQVVKESEGKAHHLTKFGMTLGTPLYMSPEQAEGKVLDHRSDIYSLGITAYHLLTGRPPFQAETAIATALLHLNKRPEPILSLCPDVPPRLAEIVHKMIEKSPANRYQTIPELLDDLKKLHAELQSGSGSGQLMSDWDNVRFATLTRSNTALSEVKQRLEKTMQLEALKRRRWSRLVLFSLFAAFLLGMIAAYAKIQARTLRLPLPAVAESVPKMSTIAEQWILACRLGNEDGWKSVIDYYPDQKSNWERKAKQQLALLYMKEERAGKAYAIFQEFADLPDYEPNLRAFGYAGFIWYYAKKNDNPMLNDALYNFSMVVHPNWENDIPANTVYAEAMKVLNEKKAAAAKSEK